MATQDIQAETFPFKWNGWDKQDELVHTYCNVSFTGNFGVFEQDEKFTSIEVNYGKGTIEAYDGNAEFPTKTQKFKAIAIK